MLFSCVRLCACWLSRRSLITTALSSAVLVAAVPEEVRAEIKMHARLEAVDAIGDPTSVIPKGTDFELRAYVDDVRTETPIQGPGEVDLFGVFAAYLEVLFDGGMVTAVGPVEAADFFNLDVVESISPGVIYGGGATSTLQNPGLDEQLLFAVPLHAAAVGSVVFTPSELVVPPDEFEHEWLMYGDENIIQPVDEALFFDLEVTIVPEPASVVPFGMALLAIGGLVWSRRSRRASRLGQPPAGPQHAALRGRLRARLRALVKMTAPVAVILVTTVPEEARAEIKLHARLEAFDAVGDPINEIPKGSDFELRAYVDDVRTSTQIQGPGGVDLFGVFAAYLEVLFDGGIVTAGGPVAVDEFFFLDVVDSISPGVIHGGGTSGNLSNPGPDEQLLFTAALHAADVGSVVFSPSYLGPTDESQTLWALYADDEVVQADDALFFDLEVTIVPEPASVVPFAMALLAIGGLVWRRRGRELILYRRHRRG